MPIDYFAGVHAHVQIGDDGSGLKGIIFTADDQSCRWNDYAIRFKAPLRDGNAPRAPRQSRQRSTFVTTAGGGASIPSDSVWPPVYVYDWLDGILSGQKMQARIRFFATAGGTSVGSVAVGPGSSCGAKPGPILGAYDSGFFDIDCGDCTVATNMTLAMHPIFTNFNPVVGVVQITDGILDIQWVPDTAPVSDYEPAQPFGIIFDPPCADDSAKILHLNDGTTDSPPTSAWENSIVVADAGIEGVIPYGAVAVGGGHGTMWWAHQEFPADQFVQVTAFPAPISPDAVYLFLRLRRPGTANVTGYMMKGTNTTAEVYRIDAGVATLIDTFPVDPPMGADSFIYRFFMTGNLYGVNANLDIPQFGSDLPSIGTGSDSTYDAAGFVGVGIDGSDGVIAQVIAGTCATCPPPSLMIRLATDICGNITTTYQQINIAVTLANLGISTTVPGTHGNDIVVPTTGVLAGAICHGSVDN